MTKYILLGDITNSFFVNMVKAVTTLPNTEVCIATLEKDVRILPILPSCVSLYVCENEISIRQKIESISTHTDYVIALDALKYGIFVQNILNKNALKMCIFTGGDTRFSRRKNPEKQLRLNISLQYFDVFGFLSKLHLQECLPILGEKPALLIPYGFYKSDEYEANDDAINFLSSITRSNLQQKRKILVIDENESEKSLTEFIDALNNDLLNTRQIYILTNLNPKFKPYNSGYVQIISKHDLNNLIEDDALEAIISLEYETELKIIRDLLRTDKRLFLRYHPLNLSFEHESRICLFSDMDSLLESLNSKDESNSQDCDSDIACNDEHLEAHSNNNLQHKIQETLEMFKSKKFLRFHEDLSFEPRVDKVAVFCYFADVESHRSSARPMRIRAISSYLDKTIPTLRIYGDSRVIRRRMNYLENLLVSSPERVEMVYEETMTVFHKIGTDALSDKIKLLDLVNKYNLKYGVYIRDMHQAYLDYYEIVGRERSVSMYENMLFELNLKVHSAKKIYVPSVAFVDEAIKRGVVAQKYRNKFFELSPGIDKRLAFFSHPYLAGTQSFIHIVYAGGMGQFYNFRKFIEAFKICKDLPIKLDLYVRSAELENAKSIYGDLQNLNNVQIVEGQFTDLAKNRSYDLGLCIFESDLYMKMAAPVKLFDYLSLNIPVLAGKNTHAGKVVSKDNIGFVVNNSVSEIVRVLIDIVQDRSLLSSKQKNIKKFVSENSWQDRANAILSTLRTDEAEL